MGRAGGEAEPGDAGRGGEQGSMTRPWWRALGERRVASPARPSTGASPPMARDASPTRPPAATGTRRPHRPALRRAPPLPRRQIRSVSAAGDCPPGSRLPHLRAQTRQQAGSRSAAGRSRHHLATPRPPQRADHRRAPLHALPTPRRHPHRGTCARCGDGPLLSGAIAEQSDHLSGPVHTWLTDHGWRLNPDPGVEEQRNSH